MFMTPQQTFDYVCHNLLQQGQRSVDDDGQCAYRGANGLKCAAGWLIPDDKYHSDFECTAACDLDFKFEHRDLVQSLQEAHDESDDSFVEQFKHLAGIVAESNGLNPEVLK